MNLSRRNFIQAIGASVGCAALPAFGSFNLNFPVSHNAWLINVIKNKQYELLSDPVDQYVYWCYHVKISGEIPYNDKAVRDWVVTNWRFIITHIGDDGGTDYEKTARLLDGWELKNNKVFNDTLVHLRKVHDRIKTWA